MVHSTLANALRRSRLALLQTSQEGLRSVNFPSRASSAAAPRVFRLDLGVSPVDLSPTTGSNREHGQQSCGL